MRYNTAVNHSGFGNHVMNFLVPRFHRESIDDLELVCQSDEDAPILEPCQRAIIPAAAAAQPISLNIENNAGNDDHCAVAIFRSQKDFALRLGCTQRPRRQSRIGEYLNKDRRMISARFSTEDFLLLRPCVIHDRPGVYFISHRAVKSNRASGEILRKFKDFRLNRPTPRQTSHWWKRAAALRHFAAQLISDLFQYSALHNPCAAGRDEEKKLLGGK